MIVNIRGTSGSGKSHIVRNIMKSYKGWVRVMVEGRRQPLGYMVPKGEHPALAVMGHYETACGGCDTIQKQDYIFELIRKAADEGYNVLFEGLLLGSEVNRTTALSKDYPVIVLHIDLPLELCLASVNSRRRIKNPDAPDVNPKNTEAKWNQVKRGFERLTNAGVECHWGTREEVEAMARAALQR